MSNTQIRKLFKLILEKNADQIQADLELIEKANNHLVIIYLLNYFLKQKSPNQLCF